MKSPMTSLDHGAAGDLQGTTLKIVTVQIIATGLILWFRADLLRFWETPLRVIDPHLAFRVFRTATTGDFIFWLWIALVAGLPLVIPWHVYFVIRHVHPGLPQKRIFSLIAALGASLLVFLGSFWIANSWFLPSMLEAFVEDLMKH